MWPCNYKGFEQKKGRRSETYNFTYRLISGHGVDDISNIEITQEHEIQTKWRRKEVFDWKSTAAFGMPPTGVPVIITLSGDYTRIVGPCYYLRDATCPRHTTGRQSMLIQKR